MRWYEKLYVGERAKKHRFSIIQNIRNGKVCGSYVLTPSSSGKNVLDIYPALTLLQPYYKQKEELLIVGVAADYDDAAGLAARIVADMYQKTGGFDLLTYLKIDGNHTGE